MIYIFFIVFSFAMTLLIKNYAIKNDILDIPNGRSSHKAPTPRGGGVAIVILFLVGTFLIAPNLTSTLIVFLSAAFLVALVGFWDDKGHVDFKWRLLVHFLAAILIIIKLGGFPYITVNDVQFNLGFLGYIFAVLITVWILNLFNFMDGIDGITGIEVISSVIIIALIMQLHTTGGELVPLLLLLASCATGFLLLNFPPAKIFMGDVGSGFLGLVIAYFFWASSHMDSTLFWCWLIVLGVFIVDATLTLFIRGINGEKVYQAHRSHAYQHAALLFNSHLKVILGVLAINTLWLMPMALAVSYGLVDGFVGLTISYLPLIGLAAYYKAGQKL